MEAMWRNLPALFGPQGLGALQPMNTTTHIDLFTPYLNAQFSIVRILLINLAIYFEAVRECEKCKANLVELRKLHDAGEWPTPVAHER